jgi:hypothetical protein
MPIRQFGGWETRSAWVVIFQLWIVCRVKLIQYQIQFHLRLLTPIPGVVRAVALVVGADSPEAVEVAEGEVVGKYKRTLAAEGREGSVF